MTVSLALLILIMAIHAADLTTTIKGLGEGLEEANPLARTLFGRIGPIPAAITLNVVLGAPMMALCVLYPRWWPVPAVYAAAGVFVVWRNFKLIRDDPGGS